ncbi:MULTISPECIES: sulfurtransferase complex subunit TusC [unclassified Photobacterium]|uniref:sulfurtransferase complex subunit TusC n=1 Tax=unclassified Photobacterium TaxID=2628852 RepID=UPI001EE12120|nr:MULTISPECIES: sulfurtransferase complex subunit TusC [unclassified Photobacterium]MCG3865374.1 sulfurtransferase complex subunit TusC [Photobacterium sp. Ph6]MCG3876633.1 sulfurtransferase complex subunit TusC [Photobacterium sp. Ph5]
MNSLGFIFRTSPHGNNSGREGLDAVLASSAYTEALALYFIDDGVFQLLKQQQPQAILSRDYIATFKMLELYDVENIYVNAESLHARGLTTDDLIIDAIVCDQTQLIEKMHQCRQLLTF